MSEVVESLKIDSDENKKDIRNIKYSSLKSRGGAFLVVPSHSGSVFSNVYWVDCIIDFPCRTYAA